VIVFKTEINMRDRQKISKSVRERQESKDEMQMTFDIFPVWVVSINGQTDLTDDQKKEWIENLTDLQLFKEVAEVLGELQTTA
jgi:alpha-L-arabinofuranosidase